MFKNFIDALREVTRKNKIKKYDAIIYACTRATAALKKKALAAQAKRDALISA